MYSLLANGKLLGSLILGLFWLDFLAAFHNWLPLYIRLEFDIRHHFGNSYNSSSLSYCPLIVYSLKFRSFLCQMVKNAGEPFCHFLIAVFVNLYLIPFINHSAHVFIF